MNEKKAQTDKVPTVDIADIMSKPELRTKLQEYINGSLVYHARIKDAQASLKDHRNACVDDLHIDPKLYNSIVNVLKNDTVDKKLAEVSQLEYALSVINEVLNINALPIIE
jgi:hypothetical protein